MKLVQGQTLAELLKARSHPSQDLARFLTIFEQIAQTVAYAHRQKKVIHRDLKPSNVMVGAIRRGAGHGLGTGQGAECPWTQRARDHAMSQPRASGQSTGGGYSRWRGLGYVAYMPPEQALGRNVLVDCPRRRLRARLDTLRGAHRTTCFVGRSSDEVSRKAAAGDISDALARLGASGADPALVALATEAFRRPGPAPCDAGEVARRMFRLRIGRARTLKAAELARVEAQARAEEETSEGCWPTSCGRSSSPRRPRSGSEGD